MITRSTDGATLVTGGNGFLGGLVSAALLVGTDRRLVLPLRTTTDPVRCRAQLLDALRDLGAPEAGLAELLGRVTLVELPTGGRVGDLDRAIGTEVDEIVNCAGCVDYFDEESLRRANIDYTRHLLRAGRTWGIDRFVHLSTAFCSGYQAGRIPEHLHPDPEPDAEPTTYTWSKRTAERLIADSGIPFLLVRPSIIIGDSRTGKYTGKNYGLYQIWRAIEGLLCREYTPIWHTIAPPVPLNLVHQDAFQAAFMGAYGRETSTAILHLVSDDSSAPTMRDLCWLWAEVYRPVEIHSYACIDDVPLAVLPRRQRRFLELAWKNFDIATRRWRFETTGMDRLRASGVAFTDASLETVIRCQQRYVEQSPRIIAHMRQHPPHDGVPPRLIEWFDAADLPVTPVH
jgi:nucleoside-diphosphate-sugar epimerase